MSEAQLIHADGGATVSTELASAGRTTDDTRGPGRTTDALIALRNGEVYLPLAHMVSFIDKWVIRPALKIQLSDPVIRITRSSREVGFHEHNAWARRGSNGAVASEIAIHCVLLPNAMATMKAILHTRIHQAQLEFPELCGAPRQEHYHTKRFGGCLNDCGLRARNVTDPSKSFGYRIIEDVIEGGMFEQAYSLYRELGFALLWGSIADDACPNSAGINASDFGTVESTMRSRKHRSESHIKYICPKCGQGARGNAHSELGCWRCYVKMIREGSPERPGTSLVTGQWGT